METKSSAAVAAEMRLRGKESGRGEKKERSWRVVFF
jgi:hypothetical protein